MLVRLASHYHRPDFGPAQVKFMVLDFIQDLGDFTLAEIEVAIREYRRNPENRFFPRPAQLLAILRPASKPVIERSRLPVFRGYPEPVRPARKSVAEVLRDHGYAQAADAWEARSAGSSKTESV